MVPSQTRLALTAITGEKLWKERIDFWQSVYGHLCSSVRSETELLTCKGFDMSVMNKTYFGEGLIDVMDAKEVVTDEFVIKVGSYNPDHQVGVC